MKHGKGYLHLIFLEKGARTWLLKTLGEAVKEVDSVKFIRKFRDPRKLSWE
jgi:hypothetical protein